MQRLLAYALAHGIDFLDDARYDDETGSAPMDTGYSEVLFGELFRAADALEQTALNQPVEGVPSATWPPLTTITLRGKNTRRTVYRRPPEPLTSPTSKTP